MIREESARMQILMLENVRKVRTTMIGKFHPMSGESSKPSDQSDQMLKKPEA